MFAFEPVNRQSPGKKETHGERVFKRLTWAEESSLDRQARVKFYRAGEWETPCAASRYV